MAKSELTKDIERSFKNYSPATAAGIRLNLNRGLVTAFEVPVQNGTTQAGLIDCVRINECFERGIEKILITCYEIKVSKSDFKSKNGHNFVGNLNYYVVPNEIYNDIKNLVPDNIGVIVYYDGKKPPTKNILGQYRCSYTGLRSKKESGYRELSDDEQKWLLLSAMKRIQRDKSK